MLANSSCIPRQMPSVGTPCSTRSLSMASRPSPRTASIAFGNAPTPGSTIASAARMRSWSRVISGAAPTRASAFSTERRLPMP